LREKIAGNAAPWKLEPTLESSIGDVKAIRTVVESHFKRGRRSVHPAFPARRKVMVSRVSRGVIAALLLMSAAVSAARGADQPPSRIVWRIGLYQGFKQACWEKKPLVVFIYQEKCETCDKMMASLTDPSLGGLADRAIFIWQDADREDSKNNVGSLIRQLGIKDVPTVVVLEVSEGQILESGRVLGYFPADEVLRRFQPMLDKAASIPAVSAESPQ
jgi:hypothetical protein